MSTVKVITPGPACGHSGQDQSVVTEEQAQQLAVGAQLTTPRRSPLVARTIARLHRLRAQQKGAAGAAMMGADEQTKERGK